MPMGRYSRVDRKKSSSGCSNVSIFVIVSVFLIGAWVLMSSWAGPQGNADLSYELVKVGKLPNANENYATESEDNSGSLAEDGVKGNDDQKNLKDESDSNVQRNESAIEESGNSGALHQEEKFERIDSVGNETVESNVEKEVETEKDEDSVRGEQNSSGDKENTGEVPSGNSGEMGQEEKSESDGTKYVDNVTIESHEGKEPEAEKDEDSKLEEQASSGGKESAREDGENKTDDEKSGAHESSSDIKQGGEVESKTEDGAEPGLDEKTVDKEKADETKLQDGEEEQSHEDSVDDSNEKTSESESDDQTDKLKQTSTQLAVSENQNNITEKFSSSRDQIDYKWKLCKVTAGPDYIPCLDNIKAIRKLRSIKHYEHQERHCPEEAPTCLVPLPKGYKIPVKWPMSREKVWFANVPHTKLAEVKGHQNWVRVSGEYLTFPGGGTQFIHGATRYIDFIQQTVADISWGKRTRVVLDVGCGVASFGGFLLDKKVITMSLAPKDVHEAQVQFALERGIPALTAVMGTKRLPVPSMAFDVVHCARCRISWHLEGGKLLLELDRALRPGGYFVWSATPVYRRDPENAGIWKAMSRLTKSMCWELVKIGKDKVNGVSVAIYKKPTSNECYEKRAQSDPPMCQEFDDPNSAWYVPLQACIHKVPTDPSNRGSQWPTQWPSRLETPPYWLRDSEVGAYGKAAPKDFDDDYRRWKLIVANSYMNGIGINWSSVRNVMDMRAVYGGFAAALKDLPVWVMNVVPVNSSESTDTLPIIYERGLLGLYHDWCESFSTYPRTYDLLHADNLFSDLKKRCNIVAVMAEVDRILRPEGYVVLRDDAVTLDEVENMAKSLKWKIQFSFMKDNHGLLCVQKTWWRPSEEETILSAIA